jgi:predicted amidohydrolase
MPSDGDPGARTLRLAAVQVESRHGLIAENHARATPFIQQAAAAGASMVVLPGALRAGLHPGQGHLGPRRAALRTDGRQAQRGIQAIGDLVGRRPGRNGR